MTTLSVTQRDASLSADSVRSAGNVPGVFYGPKEASTPIAFDLRTFTKVFKEAGESTVITLTGIGEDKDTLIHAIDFHPVSGLPIHVDFYVIEKGKKVQTHVPLSFVGEAPAVKSLGGTLMKALHEIEIEAMPKDLPHEIEIDISVLDTFTAHILIKDIKLPPGVEIIGGSPEDPIASVAEPREEVIDEPIEAIDMDAIEVEKKGKTEDPDAEAAPDAGGDAAKE